MGDGWCGRRSGVSQSTLCWAVQVEKRHSRALDDQGVPACDQWRRGASVRTHAVRAFHWGGNVSAPIGKNISADAARCATASRGSQSGRAADVRNECTRACACALCGREPERGRRAVGMIAWRLRFLHWLLDSV